MSTAMDPVVVVVAGPLDLRTPLLPFADVVVIASGHRPMREWCAELFARLPGLALVLVQGHNTYTIGIRDGTLHMHAGPVGDPTAAARAAYDRWLAGHDAAAS